MAAASRSVKASIEMRERHYPPLTFVSGYGYPYCLGRFVPVVQDRDPKFIYPSSPDFSNMMIVEMPHDIYLWMMKWSNHKVKEWWSGEIVNGRRSPDPEALHNVQSKREDVPRHVRICMTWLVGVDAREWDPRGFRWMCREMYGFLREEGIVQYGGSDSEDDEEASADAVIPINPDDLEIASMIRSEAGGLDSFFFPAAPLLRICGLDTYPYV